MNNNKNNNMSSRGETTTTVAVATPTTAAASSSMDVEGVSPAPNDVLCGRGRISFQHEGNRKFRFLIASNLSNYTQARTKKQKIDLVRSIAQTVRDRGGRFLKQHRDTKKWYDAGLQAARKKVGHSLRDASNDKIKCVLAMSKTLERNNALMQQVQTAAATTSTMMNSSLMVSSPATETSMGKVQSKEQGLLQEEQEYKQQQQQQQQNEAAMGGSLRLPVGTVLSNNAFPEQLSLDTLLQIHQTNASMSMNTSMNANMNMNVGMNAGMGVAGLAFKATSSGDDGDDTESDCFSDGESDDALDPFAPLNPNADFTQRRAHSFTAGSSSQLTESLSVFNDIDLRDLEDYCDRREEALKLAERRSTSDPALYRA